MQIQPAGSRLANGTDAAPVLVTVLDTRGDPLVGLVVTLDATGADNLLVQPATPTDADGRTTGFLASTRAETKVVGARVMVGANLVTLTATDSVDFLADPSTISATLCTVDASPSLGLVANDIDASTITVTVVDAFGNPVAGQAVQLDATGGSNMLIQPAAMTDAAGVATGTITSTLAETKQITATVNPGPDQVVILQQPMVTFVGDASAVDGSLSSAVANPVTDVVADGSDTSTVTVTVVDVNGNPVPGRTVQLASTGTNHVLSQPATLTDALGITTGTMVSIRAETKTITATIDPAGASVVVSQQPTVGFIADASTIDANLSTVTATPPAGVAADGVTEATITVQVVDANGNPVSGQTVQLAATGSNNTLVQPTAATNSAGIAVATLATTTAEDKTITATVNPGMNPVVLAQQPTVTFSGDPGTISGGMSMVSAVPSLGVVADGVDLSTITVTVLDVNGNPVPGQTVMLGATGANNALTQPAGTTDGAGMASGTIASTAAGTKTITATINPGASQIVLVQHPTVSFVGDPATISAAQSTATANPTTNVVADGVATSTVTVTVRDANGNPVAGQTVQLASSGSSNTLTQPVATTDASGVATGTVASTTSETKTITATINPGGAPVVVTQQPTVAFVGDPSTIDPAQSTATANPTTNVVADGVATSTVTVTVRDANGNPVAGQTVQLASSGSSNTLTQPAGTTDASGVATGTVASTTSEAKTITATINPGGTPVVVTQQPTVAFVGDPTTISAAQSTATANPTTNVVADGVATSTVTVTVRDANGNPVAGQTVQLASSGSSNRLTQPVATTDAGGVATGTIASTLAETKTITATIDPGGAAIAIAQQPTIVFTAAPISVDPSLSTVTASPATGVPSNGIALSTVTVTVRNSAGTPIPGQNVQIASTGTGNALTQPGAVTDVNGIATGTIASTVSETKTITATVNPGMSQVVLAQQPTVAFTGDPSQISAANSTASASPSAYVAADGTETSTITVTVRDASGAVVQGQTVALSATGSSNTLTQPATTTNASGIATGTLASTTVQTKTITATINPGPNQVVVTQQPSVAFSLHLANARYVRITGTDPGGCTGGTTPATAWRTIGKAASCAPAGATIYVGAGTYTESVLVTQSGTSANPIRFIADAAGVFMGDAGSVIVDGGGMAAAFQLDGVAWVELTGFQVVGSATSAGILVGDSACSNVTIRGNRVYGNPFGITVRNATSATLEHNSVSNNFGPGGDGVVVDNSDNVTIRDNLIYNNGRAGVSVLGSSLSLTIDANTIYQNGDDQVSIDGSGNSVTMRNNVIALGPTNGVTLFVGSSLVSSHNDVWGQSGSSWNGASASPSDLNVDPGFIDPDGVDNLLGGAEGADDDFHLDATIPSPVLDVGSAAASTIATADGLTMADRTSRTDATLDGSSPDGATVNLGYHYPVLGDPQPTLAPGDVRITYGEGAMRQPRRRMYDSVAGSWTAEESAPPTVDTIRWVVEKVSPLSNGEELVAMLAGTPSGGRIDLLRWSGQSWSRELRSIAIASGEVAKRGLDFDYERLSGDVMMVYSVNTRTPVYRTRTNTGWSAETPLPLNDGAGPNPDVNTGIVQWIEVESRPGTDEVAVAYSDSNRDLVVMVWNGSQWLTPTAHVVATDLWTSDVNGVIKNRPFDIAYEGGSGALMIALSRSTAGSIWYSRKPAGSSNYSTRTKIPSVPNFQPNHVDLGAEPGTSRIAVCGMDIESTSNPERLALATWNGTAWVNGGQYDVSTTNLANTSDGDFPCMIGWLGTTGMALCVYADSDSGTLDWARWISGSGWAVQADVPVPGKAFTDSVQIAYNSLGYLMALVSDSTGKLWGLRFDGAAWTVTNGGAPLETGLSSSASVPFDAVQKNP